MKRLKEGFPKGVKYEIVYNTTVFIEESITAVEHTLIEAIVLVFIVVLVFLQNWRATIIPMIAVPVSLVGTFAVMAMLGFSLNNLSLFGLVLAIGIVVDDAIVVVENVERFLAMGHSPLEASRKAMDEVSGPVIGIALVLCAVFVPTAFMAGITGQFFKQFALTIATSTVISAFNSLTLSPALCAILLKPHAHGQKEGDGTTSTPGGACRGWESSSSEFCWRSCTWVSTSLPCSASKRGMAVTRRSPPARKHHVGHRYGDDRCWAGWRRLVRQSGGQPRPGQFFQGFNWAFDVTISGYGRAVSMLLRASVVALVVYVGLLVGTGGMFQVVPGGFIPEQDKGYLVVNAQLQDGASLERTDEIVRKMTDIALHDEQFKESIGHCISVPGYSILTGTNISNVGGMFVILKPFEERKGKPELSAPAVAKKLRKVYRQKIISANVAVFGAPPIDGLGSTGGFKLQVQDRAANGPRLWRAAWRPWPERAIAKAGSRGSSAAIPPINRNLRSPSTARWPCPATLPSRSFTTPSASISAPPTSTTSPTWAETGK